MLLDIISGGGSWFLLVSGVLASLAAVFILLPFHEFAHAKMAVLLGDNTPKNTGRLTLNPFAHIDYLGAAALILIGFGWARPVQVNMYNFKNPKRDMALTALAGPISNLLMALVFSFVGYAVYFFFQNNVTFTVFYILRYMSVLSVSLAVFNFIPIPPLDGSRVLTSLLPDRTYYRLMSLERYSTIIIFGIILLLNRTGIFSGIVYSVLNVIDFIVGLPFNLF